MNKLEQAARQIIVDWDSGIHLHETITALREALGNSLKPKCFADYQPNHAIDRACASCPVSAECQTGEQAEQECKDCTRSHPHEEMSKCCELRTEIARLRHSLRVKELAEQAEQEPVAWGCRFQDGSIHDCICPESHAECEGDYNIPLYAAPVRTKDLTDDEIDEVRNKTWCLNNSLREFARAVIAADREKNK